MTDTVTVGSQAVCRSACAEKTDTVLTIYLGWCERDNRAVRFEFPVEMGLMAQISCPECTLSRQAERLHVVKTTLRCDAFCASALRLWCECHRGGINPGSPETGHVPWLWLRLAFEKWQPVLPCCQLGPAALGVWTPGIAAGPANGQGTAAREEGGVIDGQFATQRDCSAREVSVLLFLAEPNWIEVVA